MTSRKFISKFVAGVFTAGLFTSGLIMAVALGVNTVSAHTSSPEFSGQVGSYAPSDFYVTDLAFDPDGNVWLANLLRYSVDKYDSDGNLLFRIEDPAFKWVRTITVDSAGRVYVVDNTIGNIRIYASSDGSLIDVWTGFTCAGEIHADSQDRILVAMNGNDGCPGLGNRVNIYDTSGNLVDTFGSSGTGPGEFDRNYGLSTDANDDIYVTEVGNTARFQKFTSAGAFVFESGGSGSQPGKFNGPRSSAVDSLGNIYISDRRNDRIQKFDSSGSYLSEWGSRGLAPEQFFEMDSIEMGANDTIWVAGYHKNDIQQFDTDGNLVGHWQGHLSGDGEFSEARGLGYVDDKLFAVDGNNNRVQVFDAGSGEFLYEFGERAQGPATVFNFPRALATGPDGDLYITDDDNIRRIKPDGTFVWLYNRLPGVRSGSLGMAINDSNIIFQSDSGNHRINKIDADSGLLLAQWGGKGAANGQLNNPRGIALGSDDRLYVADSNNSRVQIFDQDGNYLDSWLLANKPRAIAIDRQRDIVYVGEWSWIRAYDYSGNELFSWNGLNSNSAGKLAGVYDIVLSPDGNAIYISEVKKAQIQRYVFPGIVDGPADYTVGDGPSVYIWQDPTDGKWQIRYNGDKFNYNEYVINITTSASIELAGTYSFEGNDAVQLNNGSLTFSGGAKYGDDGIDFYLDAPANLNVTVTLDGGSTPIPVYIGANKIITETSSFTLVDTIGDSRSAFHASFTEVTSTANVSYTGESWGASWGNLNFDIYPDLFVTNHKKCPDVFRNSPGGVFEKVSGTFEFPLDYCNDTWHDAHGGAWADFDNDGDQDLINLVDNGAGNIPDPNYFFVNNGGLLTDQALAYGLDFELGRGRTPLWFDWDNDGRLDLLEPTSRRGNDSDLPSGLLRQEANGSFTDIAGSIGYGIDITSNFALLSDLNGDDRMELIVESNNNFPEVIYETTVSPAIDIQASLGLNGSTERTRDAAIYDFNGDLKPDIFSVSGESTAELVLDGNTIETRLQPTNEESHAISFASGGDITIDLYPRWQWTRDEVFIGAAGANPATNNSFTLSAADPANWGRPTFTSGIDNGFFIWYDNVQGVWQLENSDEPSTNLVVTATDPVTNLVAIGFDPDMLPGMDRFLVWTPGGYVDNTVAAGFPEPTSARNIAVGDFDNDMDLDLYLVITGPVMNRFNAYYENQGDGTFVSIPGFGAEGTIMGRGDTATVVDVNVDGHLDLFVTNGKSKEPFDLDGPSQLFMNEGSDNHWLLIDLVGIESNRDAVGAKVYLTTDGKTQLREQSGGVHYRSQNHQRLHFGLGSNTVADEIRIHWPSGHIQTLNNIKADQLVQIHEDRGLPFALGAPAYLPGSDRGLYVWRDSFDSPYQLRAVNTNAGYPLEIGVIADKPFASVQAVDLSMATRFEQTANSAWFEIAPAASLDAGLEINTAPGSSAIVSVISNAATNPRLVNFGADASRRVPDGWLMSTEYLPLHSNVAAITDSGMTVSTDITGTGIQVRLSENGSTHYNNVSVFADGLITSANGSGLEGGDTLVAEDHVVTLSGPISKGKDGIDLSLAAQGRIGFSYERDGLFQPQRLNGFPGEHANAYRLPAVTPYDKPVYDAQTEAGLYTWKDGAGNWYVRAVGGGVSAYYEVEITSDQPFTSVSSAGFENNDTLDTSEPLTIVAGLFVTGGGTDTVVFRTAPGASLGVATTAGSDAGAEAVHIGKDKWPVNAVPVDLSGW